MGYQESFMYLTDIENPEVCIEKIAKAFGEDRFYMNDGVEVVEKVTFLEDVTTECPYNWVKDFVPETIKKGTVALWLVGGRHGQNDFKDAPVWNKEHTKSLATIRVLPLEYMPKSIISNWMESTAIKTEKWIWDKQ